MRSPTIIVLTAVCAAVLWSAPPEFSGERALEYTRKSVAFGPRPPGSPAIKQLQSYLLAQILSHGATVTTDDFTATTPKGNIPMRNIIARFPGKSGKAIVISGHYDTKLMAGFVGANDGGSSTGFLLEMLEVLQGAPGRTMSGWSGSTARKRSCSGPIPTVSMAAAISPRSGSPTERQPRSRR
jgi:hypothetical protein